MRDVVQLELVRRLCGAGIAPTKLLDALRCDPIDDALERAGVGAEVLEQTYDAAFVERHLDSERFTASLAISDGFATMEDIGALSGDAVRLHRERSVPLHWFFERRRRAYAAACRNEIAACRMRVEAAGDTIDAEGLQAALAAPEPSFGEEAEAAPPTPAELASEGLVWGYRLVRRLGVGGAAVVYEADHVATGTAVALKIVPCADPWALETVINEARHALRLRHRSAATLLDFGGWKRYYFLAYRFCAGESLRDVIRRQGCVDERTALAIARGVGAFLEHAATRAIVHGDLKPENVMLGESPEDVTVIDFGTACPTGVRSRDFVWLGSPLFVSPERMDGMCLDVRSDLYALGMTLFVALTGSGPIEGTVEEIFRWAREAAPPDPRARRPEISERCSKLVMRLLRRDPGARYQSARELLEDL